jgi:alpha-1,4-digalacturonate transport system substrate-binding protein
MIQSLKTRILPLLLLVAWVTAACAPQTTAPTTAATSAPEAAEATVAPSEEAAEEPAEASGDVVTLRMTWYDDGNEGAILREQLDRFEAENPDIRVVMDTVPYASGIQETLPLQLEAGEGPDMALHA